MKKLMAFAIISLFLLALGGCGERGDGGGGHDHGSHSH